jgi:hypothetical protein
MTTHETQPETVQPMETTEPPQAETVAAPEQVSTPAPVETPEPVETSAPTTNLDDSSSDNVEMLFADNELSDLRSRWTDVQSAFVDDPRDCVQKADGLVSDVVDQLTSSFAHARSHLEEQWDRGEQVSTEDLRLALKRYREFFERLLAV